MSGPYYAYAGAKGSPDVRDETRTIRIGTHTVRAMLDDPTTNSDDLASSNQLVSRGPLAG